MKIIYYCPNIACRWYHIRVEMPGIGRCCASCATQLEKSRDQTTPAKHEAP